MSRINLPTLFSQMDSRWASKFLGYNTALPYNIYNFGCLLTDFAMICKYYGVDTDPARLNDALIDPKVKGFAPNSGEYVWGSLPKLYPQLSEKVINTPSLLTDAQIAEIKSALDRGAPVIIQIDYNPNTVHFDMHYVVIVDYNPNDENDFTIADPLGGRIHSLKDYLGLFFPNARKTISQYCIIDGKLPEIPATINDDQKRALGLMESFRTAHGYGNDEGCINGLIGAFNDATKTQEALQQEHKINIDLQTQLDTANTNVGNLSKQVTQLMADNQTLKDKEDNQKASLLGFINWLFKR